MMSGASLGPSQSTSSRADREPRPPIEQMDALEVDGERQPVAVP
jgi:hypothetical protein